MGLGSKISMGSENVYHQDNITSELRRGLCERQTEMKIAWEHSRANGSPPQSTLLCQAHRAAIHPALDNLKALPHISSDSVCMWPTCGSIPIFKTFPKRTPSNWVAWRASLLPVRCIWGLASFPRRHSSILCGGGGGHSPARHTVPEAHSALVQLQAQIPQPLGHVGILHRSCVLTYSRKVIGLFLHVTPSH